MRARHATLVLLGLLLAACTSTTPPASPAPSATPRFTPLPYAVVCPDLTSGGGFLCDHEAQAVAAAVANVGFPIAKITLRHGAICLIDPFSSITCPAPGFPEGTTPLASAVVEFSGTQLQDFLNLGSGIDGQILTKMRLLAPPAGAVS